VVAREEATAIGELQESGKEWQELSASLRFVLCYPVSRIGWKLQRDPHILFYFE
jgi:hypothetical protein